MQRNFIALTATSQIQSRRVGCRPSFCPRGCIFYQGLIYEGTVASSPSPPSIWVSNSPYQKVHGTHNLQDVLKQVPDALRQCFIWRDWTSKTRWTTTIKGEPLKGFAPGVIITESVFQKNHASSGRKNGFKKQETKRWEHDKDTTRKPESQHWGQMQKEILGMGWSWLVNNWKVKVEDTMKEVLEIWFF